MNKVIDIYFRRTILFDIILGIIFCICHSKIASQPSVDHVSFIASETLSIILTMAGFVLTFLTIIVTFKENSKDISKEKDITSIKEHFYNSTLYSETVKHIKNTLKSLIIASISIYMSRIFASENDVLLYYVSLYSIVVLLISILKSLYIISKVIDLQIAKKAN